MESLFTLQTSAQSLAAPLYRSAVSRDLTGERHRQVAATEMFRIDMEKASALFATIPDEDRRILRADFDRVLLSVGNLSESGEKIFYALDRGDPTAGILFAEAERQVSWLQSCLNMAITSAREAKLKETSASTNKENGALFLLGVSILLVFTGVAAVLMNSRKLHLAAAVTAEDETRRRESLNALFVNFEIAHFELDSNLQIVQISQAWHAYTGFSVEESLGKSLLDYVHPEERLELLTRLSTDNSCRGIVKLPLARFMTSNGDYRWSDIRVYPDASTGNIQGIIIEADELVYYRDDAKRMGIIVQNSINGALLLDKNGICRWMNESATSLLGTDGSDAIGRHITSIFRPAGDHIQDFQDLCSAIEQQRPYDREFCMPSDDKLRWIWLWMKPVFSPEGELTSFLIIGRDITSEHEKAEALRQSEETLRLILDNALDAIVSVDENGVIVSWNPEAEYVFGWGAQEAIGQDVTRLIIPERYRENLAQNFKEMVSGRNSILKRRVELVGLRRDDQEFPIDVALCAIQVEGKTLYTAFIQDISEQKKTLDALKATNDRLSLVLAASRDGIFDWDVGSSAVFYSPRWKEMLGYEEHEIESTYEAWEQLLHPEERNQVVSTLSGKLSGDETQFTLEFRMRSRDGSYRWILARGIITRDAEGRPTRVTGSHTDITERRRAIEEIRLLNEDLEMRVCERTSELETINNELTRENQIRKKTENALRSKTEQLAAIIDCLTNYLQTGVFETAIGKLLEGALLEAESNFAIAGIVQENGSLSLVDCQSSETANPEAVSSIRSLLDIPSDELDNQLVGQVVRGGRSIITNDTAEQVAAGICVPKGVPMPRNLLGVPILCGDEVVGVICATDNPAGFNHEHQERLESLCSAAGVIFDSHRRRLREASLEDERRRAQEETRRLAEYLEVRNHELILARDEALQAARSKAEFLANMSHELRTPLNGVIGMTGLLLDTDLNPEQKEFSEVIRTSANNLLVIINDILDFSKIEAGKLDLESLDFRPRSIVEEALEMLSLQASSKKIELAYHIAPDVPELACGDEGRLRQVLLNLINNGIKFTRKGEVAVRVSLESELKSGWMVRFEVSDTGIGMPHDALDRIFQSFSQVDSSTTRQFGGTGLGLAISRRLVELMGGQIGVESKVGEGSRFWFTVQLGHAQEAQTPEPLTVSDINGLRVLIVDDNQTNRRFLFEQLASWGCRPVVTSGATEAIAVLKQAVKEQDPFQLALLDMQMPEVDGRELGRRIKSDPVISSCELAMLTSVGYLGGRTDVLDAGFADYLVKPIKQAALYECLLKCTSGARSKTQRNVSRNVSDLGQPSEADLHNARLLVVEDNQVNQQVALRLLKKLGYRADAVANGLEALKAIELVEYDLVFMDLQMPEMDGFEAVDRIRKKEKRTKQHLPIIAMTAHAVQGDRERCLRSGMDDYVSKPVSINELAEAIKRQLSNRQEAAGRSPSSGNLDNAA